MKQHKWICVNCNRTDVCACFELSDMARIPDMTIGPSHHTVSPDCATPRIYFAIEGQIFEWARRRSTETGASPPSTGASVPPFVLAELILRLIELYARKIVIIDSRSLDPHARAQALKNAVVATGKKEEILVLEEIPPNIEALASYPLALHTEDQKQTVIFVGPRNSWESWEHMLTDQGMFSLLKQSIGFYC